MEANYSIVIKTNQYAGNFERELCAHSTGIIGECEVGHEYADETITTIFEQSIATPADDNGTRRPVGLGSRNEGATGNDVVIYFDSEPTKEQVQIIKERFEERNWTAMGERQDLTLDEVELIVKNAL